MRLPRTLRDSVVVRMLIAVAIAGIVAVAGLQALMTRPLSRYYEDIVLSDLMAASRLALEECDESFERLLSLRLSNEPGMVETMRNDTIQRIATLAESFPGMRIAIVEDGALIPTTAPAEWQAGLSQVLSPGVLDAPVTVDLDGRHLVHWRYFPYWRWHLVAVFEYRSAVAPLTLAKRVVQAGLATMGLVLISVLIVSFRKFIAVPLRELGKKAEAVSGGDFETLETRRNDEVGRLTVLFNEMVHGLKEQRSINDRILEELRASVAEKEILLKEVHHRVRNNLNVIISLLNLRSENLHDTEDALAAFDESKNRIRAMALVHGHLYETRDFEHVRVDEYIRDLSLELRQIYDLNGRTALEFELAERSVDLNRAVPLGLIINEALTNCYKHAFDPDKQGTISLSFQERTDDFVFVIQDDGKGLPQDGSCEDSLGSLLMRELTDQIGGTIQIDGTTGTRVSVAFPRLA
jgi:two-component sensor histidine kinase/HAMP domain-containing protein